MCYTGGPRCPSTAIRKLGKAKESGDPAKIKEARVEWYTTSPGIQELRDRGREDAAARFEERRKKLIDRSRVLDRGSKVIAVDIDNTTGDFTGVFRDALAKKYGLTEEEALERYPDPGNYSFAKSGWFNSTQEFLSEMREAEEAGMYARMKILPSARKTLRDLKTDGYKVHFVTARPGQFNEDTKAAFRKWKVGYHKLVHEETKQNYDADVFLDDAPYQIENLSTHGKGTITFHQDYNTSTAGARVNNWTEVPSVLKKHFSMK